MVPCEYARYTKSPFFLRCTFLAGKRAEILWRSSRKLASTVGTGMGVPRSPILSPVRGVFMKRWFILAIALLTLQIGHVQSQAPPLRAHTPRQQPATQAGAQQFSIPIIDGPDGSVEPGDLVILDASRSTNAEQYSWVLANSNKTFLPVDGGKKVVFSSGTPGEYVFILATAGKDEVGNIALGLLKRPIVVGKPEPPGPGPGPAPEPVPPGPTFGKGLKFVCIYETDGSIKPPAEAKYVLDSSTVRATLTDKCSKTNNTPNWRFWDDDLSDADLAPEEPSLVAMYKYIRGERGGNSAPYVIIADDKILYAGPLNSSWDKYVLSK